jgi:hypothetical protein
MNQEEQLREFIGTDPPILNNIADLSEALYSISELGMWPDAVDSVSPEQAILCWRLIERLSSDRLPDELRM